MTVAGGDIAWDGLNSQDKRIREWVTTSLRTALNNHDKMINEALAKHEESILKLVKDTGYSGDGLLNAPLRKKVTDFELK